MNRYLLIALYAGTAGLHFASAQTAGSRFVPVTPCRIADTRNAAGPFGGPTMTAGSMRSFAIPQSVCPIPSTAQAYALNVTVVPSGPLGYLTLWPAGQPQPFVSTLNSPGGTVVANAAIVPAGSGGAVSVYVSNQSDVVLDINGYFDSTGAVSSFSFYPAAPCRVADTRNATGQLGGPSMSADQSRAFPVPLSTCEIPATASAYSLNVTAVPDTSFLGYLSTWPTGQSQPFVSTLNSWTGAVVANAAIVPAGTNGSISVFVTDPTDVVLDINGYFGQPGGTGELAFYPVTPCRVADTRNANGPFGGPELAGGSTRSFAIPASGCSIPSTAAAYSVNVTVVPDGVLYYLSTWPTGSSQPLVSTLNSFSGAVLANAAIVPAGTNGAVSVYVTNPTNVILDINGYFGPPPASTPTPTPTPTPTITSVTASCPNPTLAQGGNEQCTATVEGTGSFSTAVNWSASAGTISAAGVFTAPNAVGPVTITATAAADSTKSGTATVTATSQRYSGFTYQGITLVSWQTGEYSEGAAKTSEDALAGTGSNWAGVLVTQIMPTPTSTTIGPTSETPSDADLATAIAEFHSKGVKVMLKPHVDVGDGSWRGAIQPSPVSAWFASFTTFITHYAQVAQANGVEMLCFGTEYATMSGSANQTAWNNVIAAIRSAGYTGLLAYAANATYAGDEFTTVSFWDNPQLDVMGLDAYFPLTNHDDPTVAELVAAWSSNKNGENIVQDVLNFAAAHPTKPVIFTEIGYMSTAGTNTAPYDYSLPGGLDQQEQANCYEAMYEVWSQHSTVMQGNFWWAWEVPEPPATDTGYYPWGKLAEGVLQIWQ
ncbi:MAG: hypothetical protein ABSH46_22940 [Bryobacteraceae bacterium]